MLEIIAMLTMLTDHVGLIFFHDHEGFRLIGRIAFPVYCWLLVQGYTHTRNLKKYVFRLIVLALLSQIPYSIAFHALPFRFNVIFTLLLALVCIFILDHINRRISYSVVFVILLSSLFIPLDYGIYGILLVLIYSFAGSSSKIILYHTVLNILYLPFSIIQFFSLVGTLLLIRKDIPHLKINRTFYRVFYPLHLAVIALIGGNL